MIDSPAGWGRYGCDPAGGIVRHSRGSRPTAAGTGCYGVRATSGHGRAGVVLGTAAGAVLVLMVGYRSRALRAQSIDVHLRTALTAIETLQMLLCMSSVSGVGCWGDWSGIGSTFRFTCPGIETVLLSQDSTSLLERMGNT